MILGQETGMSFEFCHIFINTYCLKLFIQVFDDSNLMVFVCFVLFSVVGKVIVLKDYLVSWSCKDIQRYLQNDYNPKTLLCLAIGLQSWCN